jgi:hypothetical protein
MKKSVVILIALIYVAAIAVVSFFGLQFKVFNQVIPVSEIVIDNKDLMESPLYSTPYAIIELNDNGIAHYQIKCTVLPVEATNTDVTYAYDKQSTVASVDENGLVTFTGPGLLEVKIIPSYGSDVSAKITVLARMKKN